MKPTIVSLRRQFAWLVILLAFIGVSRFVAGQVMLDRFTADAAAIDDVQRAGRGMLQAMTDAETGVRGYQLTGDRMFLEPYGSGMAAYPVALERARAAASTAAVRRRLDAEDAAARRWMREFGAPIVATPAGRAGFDADLSRQGKVLFDAFRTANAATAAELVRRERAVTDDFGRMNTVLQSALAVLGVLSVLLALWLSARTHRLLLAPLGRLQDVLGRLTAGDRGARAELTGPPEVRRLAATLNESLDQQRGAEEELTAARDEVAGQRAYLQQVLDVVNMAVLTCDARGVIVELNAAARATAGEGDPPRHVADLHGVTEPGATADDALHPLELALHGRVFTSHEMVFRRPDGTEEAIMVDARPLHDATGAVTGAVATGYNVQALRDREAELTAFAGIVAHDLKAPLAAIAGYTEILDDDLRTAGPDPVDPVPLLPTLDRIRRGVARMRHLIDDLLDYATARDAPLHLEPVDLTALVRDIVTERTAHLRHGDGAVVPRITVADLPVVNADRRMIRQALDNLVGNAIKYTPPGHPPDVTVGAEIRGHTVELTVADRGIGIPADQRTQVFTSFHRAHAGHGYTGTGLGLAICQRVADRHGGTIAVTDNPGGGTRAHLTLPDSLIRQPTHVT